MPTNKPLPHSLDPNQTEYNPKGGIVITENGVACKEDDVDDALKDIERAVYLKRYLTEVGGAGCMNAGSWGSKGRGEGYRSL